MSTETGPLRRFWRSVQRRPILSALMGLALFVVFVPVWPYQPHCGNWASYADFKTLDGDMTPDYLAAIDRALWERNVYHWRIRDRIYLRLPAALDASGGFDLHGNLRSAQIQATLRLVDPSYLYSHVGEKLLGHTYWPPSYLQAFVDEHGHVIDIDDCTFIRAVAFGEPPPPGYTPEPSPFRGAPD